MSKYPRNEIILRRPEHSGIGYQDINFNMIDYRNSYEKVRIYAAYELEIPPEQVTRLVDNRATISFRTRWDSTPYQAGKIIGAVKNQFAKRYILLFTYTNPYDAYQDPLSSKDMIIYL